MHTRISGLIRPPQDVLDEVVEAVRSLLAHHVLENANGDKSFPITTEELVPLNQAANSILMSINLSKELSSFKFLIREYKKILKQKRVGRDLVQWIKDALVFLSQGKSQLETNGEIEEEIFDEIEMALDNVQGGIESRLGYMDYIELSDVQEFENYRRLLNQHPYHQIDEFSYATSLDENKDQLELPLLIHVKFIDDANNARRNPARYWESNGYHNIEFRFPKEPKLTISGAWGSSYFDNIVDSARHEMVHVMQQEIEVEQNIVEKGGFPSKLRGTKYRQKMDAEEKELKDEYRRKGLDPNLVNFHSLDDIEFYSILLDEVMIFERDFNQAYRGRHTNEDVNKEVKKAIGKRPFFKSLKQIQRKKWNKAVGIFFKEIKDLL